MGDQVPFAQGPDSATPSQMHHQHRSLQKHCRTREHNGPKDGVSRRLLQQNSPVPPAQRSALSEHVANPPDVPQSSAQGALNNFWQPTLCAQIVNNYIRVQLLNSHNGILQHDRVIHPLDTSWFGTMLQKHCSAAVSLRRAAMVSCMTSPPTSCWRIATCRVCLQTAAVCRWVACRQQPHHRWSRPSCANWMACRWICKV